VSLPFTGKYLNALNSMEKDRKMRIEKTRKPKEEV
jgi:hypothetical protein